MDPNDKLQRQINAGRVFTPHAPIDEGDLFSGRVMQLSKIFGAVSQRGQHAILYGERGVGKTSLANVLSQKFSTGEQVLGIRVNADGTDTFSTLWRKVFYEITFTQEKNGFGFTGAKDVFSETLADKLPQDISPDLVRRTLAQLGSGRLFFVIIDEFDRLDPVVRTAIADTIKMLSDHSVPATLVLVGVADSVEGLIKDHASVERALVQIPLPRMSADEIREILRKGLHHLGMTIAPDAQERIVLLAQGLPHYAHLLALHSVYGALHRDSAKIEMESVEAAIANSVDNAQMSIRTIYTKATTSPRSENLYGQVLLACALAPTDDLGYFSPAAVRDPMSVLMGKRYEIPSFARHLYDFTDAERGPVLERIGTERKYRYRFINPLLQPYIIMRGLADGRIDDARLKTLSKAGA